MILGNEAIPKELSNQGSFANLSKTFYKERFPLSEYIRQKSNILTKPNVLTLNTQKCGCLPTQITSSRPRLKMNIPTQERCLVKMPLPDFITLQLRYLTSRKGGLGVITLSLQQLNTEKMKLNKPSMHQAR